MQSKNYLELAKKSSDTVVLIITVVILVLVAVILAEEKLSALLAIMIVVGVSLFYVKLYQISFLGNAFRVQNGRHAHLVDSVRTIAHQLDMPPVDVYIAQDPYLNAFAVGYTRPYTIVLHSAIVEELSKAELDVILFHEMAHIKLKHTAIVSYVYPIGILIPVLGPMVRWIFGFWSRRAELACDRVASTFTRDPHTVVSALMKIHVGSKFAQYMSEEGVLYQDKIGSGAMRLISQSMYSHPFLVTRVREVMSHSYKTGILTTPQTPTAPVPAATSPPGI